MDRHLELISLLAMIGATAAMLVRWFEWRRAVVHRHVGGEEVGHVRDNHA